MNQRIYIAAYNQSKFGKLMDMTVPQILANASPDDWPQQAVLSLPTILGGRR